MGLPRRTPILLGVMLALTGQYAHAAATQGDGDSQSTVIAVSTEKIKDFDCKSPVWVEVLKGGFKLTSGTTLKAGSSGPLCEEWMVFEPGLKIKVGKGGVKLKNKRYPQGKVLRVDRDGKIVG